MDTAVTRPLGRLTAGRVAPPQLMLTVSGLLLWKSQSHHRYPFTLSCCLDRAQPHFSDWLTTRGLRGCAVSCMQTYYWSSLSPLTVMLCINVCVQKLLHPVWVRLKVKGFKDRFVPPLQTFPVSPVNDQTWPWFCPDPVSFVTPLIKWRESWEGWTKVRWSEISWFITMWWFVSVAGSPSAAMLPCSGHECCC